MAQKEVFPEQINTVEERFSEGDVAIAMGDLNATVSSDNTMIEHIVKNPLLEI